MNEVKEFLDQNVRHANNNFVTQRKLFMLYKSKTGNSIKLKDFNNQLEKRFKVIGSLRALNNKNKKEVINKAIEIQFKDLDGKWKSDYFKKGGSKLKSVKGIVAAVKINEKTIEIVLTNKFGEVAGHYSTRKNSSLGEHFQTNKMFGKKLKVEYYENKEFKNIKNVYLETATPEEFEIVSRIKLYYMQKYQGNLQTFGVYYEIKISEQQKKLIAAGEHE